MKREFVLSFAGALCVSAVVVAGPEFQPPIGATDQFGAVIDAEIGELPSTGRTPGVIEIGGNPPQIPAVPLPGPALMGAVGLAALMSIRRRWSTRD